MTLKNIRLQIPRTFLEKIGLTEMFVDIKRVEVLNAYQYDQNNFFSLQRILFKPNRIAFVDKLFREKLRTEYYELLGQQNDEILCILKQKRDSGFFPMFGQGPWSFLFPISIGENVITINLFAEEQYLSVLYESIAKITDSYQVIGVSNISGLHDLDQFGQFRMPVPSFTPKQRDIATYAANNGYFESPKKISAKTIAKHFGITESRVNLHLKNAENLSMKFFFGGSQLSIGVKNA